MSLPRLARAALVAAAALVVALATVLSAPAARADVNPDPGSAGGLPCSARMSMSRDAGTITMIAAIRCRPGHQVYNLDITMSRTGAGADKGWKYERSCQSVRVVRVCRKVIRFRDVPGRQTYRALWAGATHFADAEDREGGPDPRNYCKRGARNPGQIYCVNYKDTRF